MYGTFLAAFFTFHSISLASAQRRSSGCGQRIPDGFTPGGPSQTFTIQSESQAGGGTRQYIGHLPQHFSSQNDQPAPLILAFHGQTQPAWSMEQITGLSTPEFNKDAIVVQWLGDPEAPPSSEIDDRVFANELLDNLTSSLCVDESRIYAVGLSNGGGLTGLLACSPTLNRRIAAFAAVAAAYYKDTSLTEPLFEAGCNPNLSGRKVPMMEVHGLNDTVVAYDGDNSPSPNTIPLPEWINSWVERNDCLGTDPQLEKLDGGNITKSSWLCDGVQDLVLHYQINNFGHGWPSTAAQGEPFETLRLGPTTWNATTLILNWLSMWTL
ncbi:hypothetical protein DL764_004127 [Monosporascus ibericus]|uniref:feruloyl esterase n=1 Tax=Monosporascus ibericus TaxID=155417 RepID=A0A4Q4THF4_9PEZI|nr:hypothetical protein DL764_004127 [Monosporascus ibericus]